MAKTTRALPGEEVKMTEVVDYSQPVTTADFEANTHRSNSDVTARDIKRRSLAHEYAAEEKVTIIIAPMYEGYFGKKMHISINGISMAIPCDGTPYQISESFAAEAQRRLRAINEQQAKQKRFSDVNRNYESSPGELRLF